MDPAEPSHPRGDRLEPSYARVFHIAWPIIVANAAGPMLGLVDTAVIGHTGSVEALGAIALGTVVFNFIAWSFGFLRMGTTGFVAQAAGRGEEAEVRATLGRAACLGLGIAVIVLVLQGPIIAVALRLLESSPEVEAITARYLAIRLWGTPASLVMLGVLGTLIGLGESRRLLLLQVSLNVINIALDLLFAGWLQWGAAGVALGTALSNWLALAMGAFMVSRLLRARQTDEEPFWPWSRIRSMARMLETLRAHRDIMLRTLFLLFGFAWFIQQSARFGDTVLAANHVLLQFTSFSAFFLDGYANAVEGLVGQAKGARDQGTFDRAVARSAVLAGVTAVGLAVLIAGFGSSIVHLLTDLASVQAQAESRVVFAAVYVLVAVWAFLLDGIFIGSSATRDMRNASLVSVAVFVGLALLLTDRGGYNGLWLAFISYAAARALSLATLYPRLRRSIGRDPSAV